MSKRIQLKEVILIGGGGHASVVADILKQQKRTIRAIVSPADVRSRVIFGGIEIVSGDDEISKFDPNEFLLINCIGALPGAVIKKRVNEYYLSKGYYFETVIADTAYVSPHAILKSGVQIFPGAIIQAGVIIDEHSVINSGAVVEHDSYIGRYNFIAPRAVICGQCKTEDDVFIGANATVVQNIQLGKETIITAGALVVQDTTCGQKVSAQRSVIR